MANKLSKVTMAFGGATSPTAVTSQHIESLLKVIADTNVENHFSGHISLATGSISALKEYTLGAAGITYHGTVTPISYTISASSATVEEGSRVTFNVSSEEALPLGAFRFVVKSVAVTSGSITSDEVKALCKFTNNVMSVDVSGKNERWQATITVESSLVFDPNNRHTASVTAKGLMLATDFTVTGDSAVSIINGTPVTKNYTFSWLPTGGDAPSDIQVTCDSDNVTIGSIQKTGFQVVFNGTESYSTTIKVTTLGKIKEVPIVVTHKRVPTISIIGADSVRAINGSAKAEYQFGFNPSDYDVDVQLLSVVSNQSGKVSVKTGYSMAGFTLDISITKDVTATITAQFNVDGSTKTVTKVISAIYEEKEIDPPPYDAETLDTLGVAILDVYGNLYASVNEWKESGKTNEEAMGVAVSDGEHRFCIWSKVGYNEEYSYSEKSYYPIAYWLSPRSSKFTFGGFNRYSYNSYINRPAITNFTFTEAKLHFDGREQTKLYLSWVNKLWEEEASLQGQAPIRRRPYCIMEMAFNVLFANGQRGYLPTVGEVLLMQSKRPSIVELLSAVCGSTEVYIGNNCYTSSMGINSGGVASYRVDNILVSGGDITINTMKVLIVTYI